VLINKNAAYCTHGNQQYYKNHVISRPHILKFISCHLLPWWHSDEPIKFSWHRI